MIYIMQYKNSESYSALSFTIVSKKNDYYKYTRYIKDDFDYGNITRLDYKNYFTRLRVGFEYTIP